MHRWVVALTVLVVFGLGGILSLQLEQNRRAAARSDALAVATRMARQIDQHLVSSLASTHALSALVRQGNGEVRGFDAIAAELLSLYPGVSALQLAPGGVIRAIVPLRGNEKAIGHNLLADSKRNKEARSAIATGRLTLAGPFELVQGGMAIIGRLPVFTGASEGKFWGFTIALIRMDNFLATTRIVDLEREGYSYELWRTHPDSGVRHVFAHSELPLGEEPVSAFLDVPNGRWHLSVVPVAGWGTGNWLLAGLLGSLVLASVIGLALARYLKAQQALVEGSLRYRALVEASAQIVWSCDAQGRVTEDSPGWRAYTGQSFEAWRGLGYRDCIHPEDRERVMSRWLEGLARGEAIDNEYRLWHVSGTWRWNHARGVPIKDATGAVLSWVGMNIDIHDKRLAEDALRDAVAVADAANRAKSQFIAVMSHEIRTPMNGVLGMAQLLLMPGLSEAERIEFARTIIDSGQTLQALLNDILDLSKVEAGKLKLERVAYVPEVLARDAVALFADVAKGKGLVLEVAVDPCAASSYVGDPLRLRQMLNNLVSNAVKFTAQGTVRVEVIPAGAGAMLEFAVSDSGIGIAAEQLAHLFEPFSQEDASTTRKYGGTGLGLSIVRNLAHLMGGEVGVSSVQGQGARFWFRVPAEASLPDPMPVSDPASVE